MTVVEAGRLVGGRPDASSGDGTVPQTEARPGSAAHGLLPAVAVTVACLVASTAYSGAVTVPALLLGLVPSLLVSSGAAALAGRWAPPRLAGVAGVVIALAAAEVVNIVAGQGNGPAARSTFAAAGFTALAVAAARSPYPTLFLAPLCGVLFGALSLGAGAEVQGVTVAVALVAVVALGVVEAHRRRWSGRSRGRVAVVVLALLAGAAAAIGWQSMDHRLDRAPAVLSSTSVDADIRPPAWGSETKPSTNPAHGNESASPRPSRHAPADQAESESGPSLIDRLLRWGLILIGLGLLLLALRRLWVIIAWRGLRRRLRRTEPAASVGGAWVWAGRRLRLYNVSFAPSLSPDRVAHGGAIAEVPRRVSRPLEELADRVTLATFAGGPDPVASDVADAWRLADLAGKGARRSLAPSGLVRAWFRAPTARSRV